MTEAHMRNLLLMAVEPFYGCAQHPGRFLWGQQLIIIFRLGAFGWRSDHVAGEYTQERRDFGEQSGDFLFRDSGCFQRLLDNFVQAVAFHIYVISTRQKNRPEIFPSVKGEETRWPRFSAATKRRRRDKQISRFSVRHLYQNDVHEIFSKALLHYLIRRSRDVQHRLNEMESDQGAMRFAKQRFESFLNGKMPTLTIIVLSSNNMAPSPISLNYISGS